MSKRLGKGGEGPWEDRTAKFVKSARFSTGGKTAVVAGHLNQTFSVQRRQYREHPGIDVLTIGRHNGANVHPGWAVLQRIKDQLAPSGPERFGLEVYPPTALVVDNAPLWHVWVMPLGWEPGFGLHADQVGKVHL